MENCIYIEALDLQYNRIRERGFQAIIQRVKVLPIKIIYFQIGNVMSISNLRDLFTPLTLCFDFSRMPKLSVRDLYHRVGIRSLVRICLSEMKLGNQGAIIIADNFANMPYLTAVYFIDNEVGDEGANAFAVNLLSAIVLLLLDLSKNEIPFEYIERFERAN